MNRPGEITHQGSQCAAVDGSAAGRAVPPLTPVKLAVGGAVAAVGSRGALGGRLRRRVRH